MNIYTQGSVFTHSSISWKIKMHPRDTKSTFKRISRDVSEFLRRMQNSRLLITSTTKFLGYWKEAADNIIIKLCVKGKWEKWDSLRVEFHWSKVVEVWVGSQEP